MSRCSEGLGGSRLVPKSAPARHPRAAVPSPERLLPRPGPRAGGCPHRSSRPLRRQAHARLPLLRDHAPRRVHVLRGPEAAGDAGHGEARHVAASRADPWMVPAESEHDRRHRGRCRGGALRGALGAGVFGGRARALRPAGRDPMGRSRRVRPDRGARRRAGGPVGHRRGRSAAPLASSHRQAQHAMAPAAAGPPRVVRRAPSAAPAEQAEDLALFASEVAERTQDLLRLAAHTGAQRAPGRRERGSKYAASDGAAHALAAEAPPSSGFGTVPGARRWCSRPTQAGQVTLRACLVERCSKPRRPQSVRRKRTS